MESTPAAEPAEGEPPAEVAPEPAGAGSAVPEPAEAGSAVLPEPAAEASAKLGSPAAFFFGWCVLALANAAFIAKAPREGLSVGARAAHHFFDAGQLVAVGLVFMAAIASWQRWVAPPGLSPKKAFRRRLLGHLVHALLAIPLGVVVLPDDLVGPVSDLAGGNESDVLLWACSGAAALVLCIPPALTPLVRRHWSLRAVVAVIAVGVAVVNNVMLQGDYRGIHTLAAVASASAFGAALGEMTLPGTLGRAARAVRPLRVALPLIAVLLIPAAIAVIVRPSRTVRAEITRIEGAVVAPFLVWQEASVRKYAGGPTEFKPRDKMKPVRPTEPPFLEGKPIVLFITMDSVRAEVLEKPEYLEQLPVLKELAADSVNFTGARSVGSGTVMTFSQLFMGKHVFQLKWSSRGKRSLPGKDRSVRFPELLKKAGVRTVTYIAYAPLMPGRGILKGFDEATFLEPGDGQEHAHSAAMVNAAVERIREHDGGPMFMFLHFMDPHAPYDAVTTEGDPFDRYVAEVGLCSESIGRLVSALKEKGLWDRTILIVSADHGEGFNKHGVPNHNRSLHEEILHVPLFFRIPGVAPRRIDTPVSLLDVPPTILNLYGLPTPGPFMGESLLPFLRGKDPEMKRPIAAASLRGGYVLYEFPYKVIVEKPKVEVFDLEKDPDERKNLADSKGDEMAGKLDAFIEAHGLKP